MSTGSYLSHYQRTAADSWVAHIYTNKQYNVARKHFVSHFSVLNRGFTEDEVKQFLHNEDLQTRGRKKYVYNPAIHASEEEYKEEYDRINSGKYILSKKSKQEIKEKNAAKIENGEEIIEKPAPKGVANYDHLSLRLNISQAFNKEHVLQ